MLTRRKLLAVGVVFSALTAAKSNSESRNSNKAQELPVTPSCGSDNRLTPPQTAGPFYTPDTPKRIVLYDATIAGEKMVLEGRVLTDDCKPIANAMLDFWSCDGDGVYDNDGYRLRGHQFSDAEGRYRLVTNKPGSYGAGFATRTPHIHVKVQGPKTRLLTTQLYFAGELGNHTDGIFDRRLVVKDVGMTDDGSLAKSFDFVLKTSA